KTIGPIQNLNTTLSQNIVEPLIWWKMHQTEFPLLSNLARSIQASSVPCEQLFSVAGMIINKTRNTEIDYQVIVHGHVCV
ncbi:22464_t:CDS:2, partial [Gigaspora rosea]